MAIMIPALEPQETRSPAELSIYRQLESGLSDDFTVIHSLPWLCSAVKKIDSGYAITGEIDFLIIHAEQGVLALEVKAGRYKVNGVEFVCISGKDSRDPVGQLRRNVHGLANWLGADPELHIRIGYGLIFPDSEFPSEKAIPSIVDASINPGARIVIDYLEMPRLAKRVQEIMGYWRSAGVTHRLGVSKKKHLVATLCPHFDGTPSWGTRLLYDDRVWLRLTPEQSSVLETAESRNRMLISGWPGTGKTVIAAELARRKSSAQRGLIVVFNALLREHLEKRLAETSGVDVFTWHGLCRKARAATDREGQDSVHWHEQGCLDDLKEAINAKRVMEYDFLIIDEAQALRPEWVAGLVSWFEGKEIHAFCDESQMFSFERGSSLDELSRLLAVAPFYLTAILRTPAAVTDRLKQVKTAHYCQLTSPRRHEADTLREIITDDWKTDLKRVVDDLLSHGLQKADITILTRLSLEYASGATRELLGSLGGRCETVGRFRGLESPIVIILDGEYMDEAQLFCAYSRATSLCIVLYSPEELAWTHKGMGRFGDVLMKDEGVGEKVASAREQAQTASLVKDHVLFLEQMNTVRLGWSEKWSGWCIELQESNDPAETWIDFLATEYPWPIYCWDQDSRRKVSCVLPLHGFLGDIVHRSFRLEYCEICQTYSPHRADPESECAHCANILPVQDSPDESVFKRIASLDKIVHELVSAHGEADASSKELPVPLAAVAHRVYASRHGRRDVGRGSIPVGKSVLYRLAMAFTLARIAVAKNVIERDKFADGLFNRYCTWDSAVTSKEWRSRVAIAFSVCMSTYGLLRRESRKGLFSAVEVQISDPG